MKREAPDLKSLKPLREGEGQGQTISCSSAPGVWASPVHVGP